VIVVGVGVVGSESAGLEIVTRHHLSTVCDRIVLVVDAVEAPLALGVLQDLVRQDLAVVVRTSAGPLDAPATLTELAREAHADGADWVVPLDPGVLWTDRQGQPLRPVLMSAAPGEVRAAVVTMAQDRAVLTDSPQHLLKARWHLPSTGATRSVFRPTDAVSIDTNGAITGARGWSQDLSWVSCLHLPVPARAALDDRRTSARRRGDASWGDLSDTDLEDRWRAASVAEGQVETAGGALPVQSDVRWASAVWRTLQEAP
jgi:hypothetical protein